MKAASIVIGLMAFAAIALATPDAATWRRQTLLGENAEFFFRYVAVREYPASHYSYRQTLRLEKVRKSDMQVVEQFPLRDVAYSQDPNTDRWSEQSVNLPPFDLSGYLRVNAVHLAFADDLVLWRSFAIDSLGVWEVFDDGRVELAGYADLLRQIPNLGDDPRVVGIESTDHGPVFGGKAFLYLRIWSGAAAGDMNWSEDLLLVNRDALH